MQDIHADRQTDAQHADAFEKTVSIVAASGEWNVVIVEMGLERCQSFLQKDWAMSYARGQRIRLGLPSGSASETGESQISN